MHTPTHAHRLLMYAPVWLWINWKSRDVCLCTSAAHTHAHVSSSMKILLTQSVHISTWHSRAPNTSLTGTSMSYINAVCIAIVYVVRGAEHTIPSDTRTLGLKWNGNHMSAFCLMYSHRASIYMNGKSRMSCNRSFSLCIAYIFPAIRHGNAGPCTAMYVVFAQK